MNTAKKLYTAALFTGMLALSACGFRPIYATTADGVPPLNKRIAVHNIAAPETVRPLIVEALNDRIFLVDGQKPKYELNVTARESAERLAVQIDATVTRYNYRLRASYSLVDLENGERRTGNAQAVTSYNIVSSQYSTLFAERTAQEKASRLLAEEIERDLLIEFSAIDDEADTDDSAGEEEAIDLTEETLPSDADPSVIRINDETN